MQNELMNWKDNKTPVVIKTTKKHFFSYHAEILSWDEIGIVINNVQCVNLPYHYSNMKSGKLVIPWNNIISIYENTESTNSDDENYDDCCLDDETEESSDNSYNSEFDIRNVDGNADFFMSCD